MNSFVGEVVRDSLNKEKKSMVQTYAFSISQPFCNVSIPVLDVNLTCDSLQFAEFRHYVSLRENLHHQIHWAKQDGDMDRVRPRDGLILRKVQ